MWAAAERKRVMGQLAAWQVAMTVNYIPFRTAAPPDPDQANPYRERTPPTAGQQRLQKWMARRRWRGALRALSGDKWKG
ncbi:hypothetical protein J0H58_21600 [bacterium]|nr:hypothetical protein [bacterium]